MQTIATINKCILDTSQAVISWVENQESNRFNVGPTGKWDTSQHISHLTKTAQMVTNGLSYPKLLLKWKFGKTNRPMRDKSAIVAKYQEKLSSLPPGTTFEASAGVTNTDKEHVVTEFATSIHDLIAKVEKSWSESAMDKNLLPHPLMGRMPVRELLIWVAAHHTHHLDILKEKY